MVTESTPLRLDLDRSSPVPLYHQLASAIEAAIADGQLAPGTSLENEIALAARLGISRPTARQALKSLVDRGLLVRRRGVGTQVAPAQIHRSVGLTSLYDDLAGAGRRPATELLEWQPVEASAEVAAELEVEPGAPVVMVRRLRTADGEPIALLTNYLPEHLAPPAEDLERTGLYECLRARGTQPAVARQRIGARVATAAEARALGEGARSAVLTAVRVAFDDAGRAIESGHHVYRASVYAFETTMFAR
ncbi:GntR family transcriptional regulator [Actinotalea caeni]